MKGRIKVGAKIYQDMYTFVWPGCNPPESEYKDVTYEHVTKNPNAVFDMTLYSSLNVECRREGFGGKIEYGAGAIIVKIDDVEII